ncbi:MAG: gas vesicle protein K [Parcubacteria group bacterium]|nr:gas vesicle protein K [Parcubacteria group bacterium]
MNRNNTYQNKSLARSLPRFRPDLKPGRSLTTHDRLYRSKKVTLIDALDRVIDKGAYVDGELVLRVADIDLVFIGLRLIVTSVSNAERLRAEGRMGKRANPTPEDLAQIQKLEKQLKDIEANIPKIIEASDPEKAEQGIAKLVLTLIELIRQLLEREAVRRVDTGMLSDTEVEKLGLTFKALEKKIQEMKAVFGIKEELNLDLGPLGRLL